MSYRVEISQGGRAGCSATHCKKEGIKIQKGEIRQGTQVTIQGNTTMKWRHWGCVTPKVLSNWNETSEGNPELIDGFEELPPKAQEKVRRALAQVHVDDEDWNGDVEVNRYNPDKPMQGMFLKKSAKQKKEEEELENASDEDPLTEIEDPPTESSPAKKQATKKRARAIKEEDGQEAEPAPKRGRGRAKAKTEDVVKEEGGSEEEAEAAPKRKTKGRTKVKNEDANDSDQEALPAKRGKKSKRSTAILDDSETASASSPAARRASNRKPKPEAAVEPDLYDVPDAEEAPAMTKKGKKGKKVANQTANNDNATENTIPDAKPQKRKGRKAAATKDD
ncbi:hypothetical protein BDY17DRAFT_320403 [Neohortaea acidophila]|uniref:PARP-type domain-containing protein n=1 Tax=Neohortaea acidophila TaxID=245834 RepID=A0A6A6Q737_9PEZI|nr:uncharacterized protein BDY17DRAFT_320403 [Neohortaea acidophila]KAF2487891.1 hypothetical protein BDY17DRAFT_320403 [Neohortaea acidophila]